MVFIESGTDLEAESCAAGRAQANRSLEKTSTAFCVSPDGLVAERRPALNGVLSQTVMLALAMAEKLKEAGYLRGPLGHFESSFQDNTIPTTENRMAFPARYAKSNQRLANPEDPSRSCLPTSVA